MDADCARTCNGAVGRALVDELRARAATAQKCYQRALRTAAVQGSAVVRLVVAASGAICHVDVDLPPQLAILDGCLRERFTESSLPPPGGGCARVNIPINFVISEGDGGTGAGAR